jgi:hypothetical protein
MLDIDKLIGEGTKIGDMAPGTVFIDYCGDHMTKISHPDDTENVAHAAYISGAVAMYCYSALGIVKEDS